MKYCTSLSMLFLTLIVLLACATSRRGVSVVKGKNPGDLKYIPYSKLLHDLKKKNLDHVDYEVERKILPPGGMLKYKWSKLGGSGYVMGIEFKNKGIMQKCYDGKIKAAAYNVLDEPGLELFVHRSKARIECGIRQTVEDTLFVNVIDDNKQSIATFQIIPPK